ncbi:MAG TPA: hypothetical protein VFH80_14570 [Solirubrobacteraceae bacterium]|nr:hypothetical protein [Solirubrobacteraceae bacterium]
MAQLALLALELDFCDLERAGTGAGLNENDEMDDLRSSASSRSDAIASWLEMHQSDFERAYLGKSKDGRPKRHVTVSNASRLMIALGRAPNDLPGC